MPVKKAIYNYYKTTNCRKNGYTEMLKELRNCIDANNQLISHILKDVEHVFENRTVHNKG